MGASNFYKRSILGIDFVTDDFCELNYSHLKNLISEYDFKFLDIQLESGYFEGYQISIYPRENCGGIHNLECIEINPKTLEIDIDESAMDLAYDLTSKKQIKTSLVREFKQLEDLLLLSCFEYLFNPSDVYVGTGCGCSKILETEVVRNRISQLISNVNSL